jgi:methionine-rich copper-binding protein CopC
MKRFITALGLSFVLSLGFVFAHSELESSTPEDGATLSGAPAEIVLTFKENVETGFSIFKVYALPADMITDAAASSPSATTTHDESEASSEETTSESETTKAEHTEDSTSTSGDAATAEEGGEHGAEGGHDTLDTAASAFVPTVIDLQGDEDARADAGVATTGSSNTVTINLKENLAPGAYVTMFRILSEDTHTVEGFITFEIAP